MTTFTLLQLKALAAIRELATCVEFAEQARDGIEDGTFSPRTDTEIDSAESALLPVRSCVDEIEELLQQMRIESGWEA